uniref:uncharacterized protein LOC120331157 n=1 Tax=Styela clava TaxID=7725 RepID=UPI00193979B6|nr:uncharacterized protein LOC120331157 [Styela clava]
MAESNDNINEPAAADELVNRDNDMLENMSVTGFSEATENNVIALLTIPTQGIIPVLPNESQSTSKDCHSASIKDLFLRGPDVESDVQPSSEKNNQGASVASGLAEEGSTNAHAMTTRSKIKTNKSKASKINSQQHRSVMRSLITSRSGTIRSRSSCLTRMSNLSDSQIENIFETRMNQQRRTELEKQQLQNRLESEKQIWENNNQVENLNLDNEWQQILQKQQAEERKRKAELEAFQHRRQQMLQRRNIEMEQFNKRKQMNLQEIEDKNQREQLELDTNLNETLAERGVLINTPPVAASVEISQQPSNSSMKQTKILNVTSPIIPALSTPFSTPNQLPVSRSCDVHCEGRPSERVNTAEHENRTAVLPVHVLMYSRTDVLSYPRIVVITYCCIIIPITSYRRIFIHLYFPDNKRHQLVLLYASFCIGVTKSVY